LGAATSSEDPRRRELLFARGQELSIRKWHGASGWQLARAAVVAGALARGAVLRGERRQDALRRSWHYGAGPSRLARRAVPGP
ncbi:MAG: hypothetical protein ACRDZX_05330, partial [Acidimicrobiales bacterium]